MIILEKVGKSFNGKWAVKGLDIHVEKGEIFGLLGPNAAGKTTTIKMMTGLLYPNFKYENIASISMIPGGMFFMLIAFLIVLLTVSLEVWSFYIYKKAVISGMELSFMQKGYFVLAGLFIIIINSLAFYLPMRMGKKCLEEDLSL